MSDEFPPPSGDAITDRKRMNRQKQKVESSFAAPSGYAARLEELRHKMNERIVENIQNQLDAIGVPEWVENSDSAGVPSNSPTCRLQWFLARRKNVNPSEVDGNLQREMAANVEYAKRHNEKLMHGGKNTLDCAACGSKPLVRMSAWDTWVMCSNPQCTNRGRPASNGRGDSNMLARLAWNEAQSNSELSDRASKT